MSGVARDGCTQADLGWDLAAPFAGHNGGGGGIPFFQWVNGKPPLAVEPPSFLTGGGVRTAAGGGSAAASSGRVGVTDDIGMGSIFFEHIHILPRAKIEFGNIISQVNEDYEIYNAYRETTATESTITNNASPGVDLPNNSTPQVLLPLTSLLDPTTTGQTTGALGTMVKMEVSATIEGLPSFDTSIVFAFTTGTTVSLFVSGTRVLLMPYEHETITENLAFLTDVITALDGKEQRLALRSDPRQIFSIGYKLEDSDFREMQMILHSQMDATYSLPLWHEQVRTTAAVSASATSISVSGADVVDFRVGGLAVIYTDASTFDVFVIASVSANTVTAVSGVVNSYAAGVIVAPVRLVQISKAVQGTRYRTSLQELQIDYEVTDNTTGALAGDDTPGFWSTYNSRVLFDDCNVMGGTISESYTHKIHRIDNATGIVSHSTSWAKNKRVSPKGFFARSRADILDMRNVLLALRGKQKSFYIPTFADDLAVAAQLTISTNTMDIDSINYTRYADDAEPKRIFRVTFTDGTSLVRVVQSSAAVSATVERLTLNTTWPATRAVSEVSRVQFYELSRFDTDNFQIQYPRVGLATLTAPVKTLFDDD